MTNLMHPSLPLASILLWLVIILGVLVAAAAVGCVFIVIVEPCIRIRRTARAARVAARFNRDDDTAVLLSRCPDGGATTHITVCRIAAMEVGVINMIIFLVLFLTFALLFIVCELYFHFAFQSLDYMEESRKIEAEDARRNRSPMITRASTNPQIPNVAEFSA